MLEEVLVEKDHPLAVRLKEISVGFRVEGHLFHAIGDPDPNSPFVEANAFYQWEKASDWCHEYLSAAIESALLWADFYAPLNFDPSDRVRLRPRPIQGLARSCLESASQAIWVMIAEEPRQLSVRHLRLVNSDFAEQRKAYRLQGERIENAKRQLERFEGRYTSTFEKADVTKDVTYMSTVREAAVAMGVEPDEAEFLWRLASGATHGKRWAALEINEVELGQEYEKGQHRVARTPSLGALVAVLSLAYRAVQFGVVVFAARSGADLQACRRSAMLEVAREMPVDPKREGERQAIIDLLSDP